MIDWKPVYYNQYEVSRDGQMRDRETKELLPLIWKFDYHLGNTPFVLLIDPFGYDFGSRPVLKPVTYFVAQAFLHRTKGSKGQGSYIIKKDPDPLNNNVNNLLYCNGDTQAKMMAKFQNLPDMFAMTEEELADYRNTEGGENRYKLLELSRKSAGDYLEALVRIYVYKRAEYLSTKTKHTVHTSEITFEEGEASRLNNYIEKKTSELQKQLNIEDVIGEKGYIAF